MIRLALLFVLMLSATARADYFTSGGGGIGGAAGAMTLVSTQTASNSTDLHWTGLTGANYRFLCNGLYPATDGALVYLQFGEGATPTWETSNYQWVGMENSGTALTAHGNGTDSGIDMTISVGAHNTQSLAISFVANVMNLTATLTYKAVSYQTARFFSSFGFDPMLSLGNYVGDTNAITALRFIMSTGNITGGTCSLYAVSS